MVYCACETEKNIALRKKESIIFQFIKYIYIFIFIWFFYKPIYQYIWLILPLLESNTLPEFQSISHSILKKSSFFNKISS